ALLDILHSPLTHDRRPCVDVAQHHMVEAVGLGIIIDHHPFDQPITRNVPIKCLTHAVILLLFLARSYYRVGYIPTLTRQRRAALWFSKHSKSPYLPVRRQGLLGERSANRAMPEGDRQSSLHAF